MTYPRLPPAARPTAAGVFRQTRRRLAHVRAQEKALPPRRTFREEMIARTVERLRRETRLELRAMRQILHALFG